MADDGIDNSIKYFDSNFSNDYLIMETLQELKDKYIGKYVYFTFDQDIETSVIMYVKDIQYYDEYYNYGFLGRRVNFIGNDDCLGFVLDMNPLMSIIYDKNVNIKIIEDPITFIKSKFNDILSCTLEDFVDMKTLMKDKPVFNV